MRYSTIRETHVRKIVAGTLSLCAACALLAAAGVAGDDPREVLDRVRKNYDSIKDAEVKFTERTRFSLSNLEQRTNGTLLLKKEHKYRIETEDQTVVTDGETVWSYSVPNNQVLIDRFKEGNQTLSPEHILAGAPDDFGATIVGREQVGKVETIVLKLIPRGEHSLVSALRLWIDTGDWLIRKAELTDVNGKETTYTVSDIRVNAGLSDSRFTMQIPEGAEVVDLR